VLGWRNGRPPYFHVFFLLSFTLIIGMLEIAFTFYYNGVVICCELKYVMHAH
jgi:hypothetical protein